jgi:alkaline phosphatase D
MLNNSFHFITISLVRISFLFLLFIGFIGCKKKTDGPYFATGIKIGEVTSNRALVWIRLTNDSLPKGLENPFPDIKYRNPEGEMVSEISGSRNDYSPVVVYPEGHDVSTLEGATTGIPGDVVVYYKPEDSDHWLNTDWTSVDGDKDFTAQINLPNLLPNKVYELRVVSRYPESGSIGETLDGSFKTAPEVDEAAEVLFSVSTGQAYGDQDAPEGGFKIYNAMAKLGVDFFVHTGDIVYYDNLAKNEALARWHWSRTYSLPTNLRFHKKVTSYFIKDDHDTWINDCWPGYETRFMGDFTFEQGQAIFLEQVPMKGKTYRTYRWGKDLQIWLMEGRDFRSPNTDPDGPDKTIWGKEQKDWLFSTVEHSDATFKILISPTPIVGPDRLTKHDNHSNKDFAYEGNEVRNFIAGQKNMFVVCGDRHWQYVSKDKETGIKEFSCGPASNEHAGGWRNDMVQPEHEYLNVIGGFLAVQVTREDEVPVLIMTHYSVEGDILNSEKLQAK